MEFSDLERFDSLKSAKIVQKDAFGKQVVPGDIVLYADKYSNLNFGIVSKLVNTGIRVLSSNSILYSGSFMATTDRLDKAKEEKLKKDYSLYVKAEKIKKTTVLKTYFGAYVLEDGTRGFCEFTAAGMTEKECFLNFSEAVKSLKGLKFYAFCKGTIDGCCIFSEDFSFNSIFKFGKKNTPLMNYVYFEDKESFILGYNGNTKLVLNGINSIRSIVAVTSEEKELHYYFQQQAFSRSKSRPFYNSLYQVNDELEEIEANEESKYIKDLCFGYSYSLKNMNPENEQKSLLDLCKEENLSLFKDWRYFNEIDYRHLKMFKMLAYLALGISFRPNDLDYTILFSSDDSQEDKAKKLKAYLNIAKFIHCLTF